MLFNIFPASHYNSAIFGRVLGEGEGEGEEEGGRERGDGGGGGGEEILYKCCQYQT